MSEIVPDLARVTVGVTIDRSTATQAAADVARAAQAVVDAVKAEGIPDGDVRSEAVTLAPLSPDRDGAASPRTGTADLYRGSTLVSVLVSPVDHAGALLSHLIDKGANLVEGIDYGSSQEGRITDDLRAEAARDARRKAEIYVAALGLRLGRVLEITPVEEPGFQPRDAMRKTSILATPALPVRPGTLTLRAAVSVRWEVLQGAQAP